MLFLYLRKIPRDKGSDRVRVKKWTKFRSYRTERQEIFFRGVDYNEEVRKELGLDEEGNMQYPPYPEDSDEKYEEESEAQKEQEYDSGDQYLLFGPEKEKKKPQRKIVSKENVESKSPRGKGTPPKKREKEGMKNPNLSGTLIW